jgi:hypothetical protein
VSVTPTRWERLERENEANIQAKAKEFARRTAERDRLRAEYAAERDRALIEVAAKDLMDARRNRGVFLPEWEQASEPEKIRNRIDAAGVIAGLRRRGLLKENSL